MIPKRFITKFLINKRFQFKIIGILSIPLVLSALVYSYFVTTFFNNFFTIGEHSGLDPDHIFFEFMQNQKVELIQVLALSVLVTSVVFFIFGLVLSHRVAGPMFRLRQHLKDMEQVPEGELEKISFRKNDFFKDIENAYNSFVISQNSKAQVREKKHIKKAS